MSFATALPEVVDGVATLSVQSTYKGTEALTIPVEFTGTAVKGTDYTLSAEAFVLGGAKPVTEITLTPKEFGTKKTVTATLKIPSALAAGKYPVLNFTLADKLGYKSFETKASLASGTSSIFVKIVDGQAKPRKMIKETRIPVKVAKGSTAVEGKNFKFVDGPFAVIPQGESDGVVKIEIIEPVTSDNDLLKLAFDTDSKFNDGQYIETSVRLLASVWSTFSGKWKVTELIPTAKDLKDIMGLSDTDVKGYPVFNAEDCFTIDTEKGVLVPEFKSELKNFFTGTTNIAKDEVLKGFVPDLNSIQKVNIQMFNLDNVNRNFDSATQSKDKNAYVGVIMSKDDKGADMLSLYLLDYSPTSFLKLYYDYGMFSETRPTAIATYVYIALKCKRAE